MMYCITTARWLRTVWMVVQIILPEVSTNGKWDTYIFKSIIFINMICLIISSLMCLSIYLFIYLFMFLCMCKNIYWCVCLLSGLFVNLSIWYQIYMAFHIDDAFLVYVYTAYLSIYIVCKKLVIISSPHLQHQQLFTTDSLLALHLIEQLKMNSSFHRPSTTFLGSTRSLGKILWANLAPKYLGMFHG